MLFNSIHFLLFFPIVISIYFATSYKYRWIILLLSSYYFYMSWKPEYIILIIFSTLVDYYIGIKIYENKSKKIKKILLFTSIFTNLGILFAFKYFNFFNDIIRDFIGLFSITFSPLVLNVLLPVGISFYTFQTLSYTIDIYRGEIKPERHLGIFAVYVSFFPQLVAGPIERAKNLLPQFFEKYDFDYKRVTDGLKLMLWGFFKKIVIADRLAVIVNIVYNDVNNYTGLPLLIATLFFAFQIYCDFSGYSDIAIGAAKIMGFNLMDNFKRPYFSKSISEFWKRWHISLSSWFKDYLYIPLGGNRVSVPRWYVNLFIVFAVSGLWHGANLTFIIWGALHGFYLVFALITEGLRTKFVSIINLDKFPRTHQLIQVAITFILVNIGWIFFRANSLNDAIYILTHLFSGLNLNIAELYGMGLDKAGLIVIFTSILIMEFVHLIQEHRGMRSFLSEKPTIVRWSIYSVLIIFILLFGTYSNTQFIYFQF